jgi:hypothetical protein
MESKYQRTKHIPPLPLSRQSHLLALANHQFHSQVVGPTPPLDITTHDQVIHLFILLFPELQSQEGKLLPLSPFSRPQ